MHIEFGTVFFSKFNFQYFVSKMLKIIKIIFKDDTCILKHIKEIHWTLFYLKLCFVPLFSCRYFMIVFAFFCFGSGKSEVRFLVLLIFKL